jgi:hypothetical protein
MIFPFAPDDLFLDPIYIFVTYAGRQRPAVSFVAESHVDITSVSRSFVVNAAFTSYLLMLEYHINALFGE